MNLSEEEPLLSFQLTRQSESSEKKRRSLWEGKDGALGWTVAISIMVINFITIGLGRMSGILYVDFMREYHVNRKFASAPFSIQSSTRNLFGPVAGLLGHKFGLRALTIAGGLIGAISAAACAFAVDITWIIVFWGAFYGIGIAFTSTLNQVILDEYFDHYLSSASGLSFSGGSLGAMVFAFALQRTIDDYGLENSFFIMGAVILLVVPLALTLTSPPWAEDSDIPSVHEEIIQKSYYPSSQTERKSSSSGNENDSREKSFFWPPIKSQKDDFDEGDKKANESFFWSREQSKGKENVEQKTKSNLTSNIIFARLKVFGNTFNIGKEPSEKTVQPKYDLESELIFEAESKIENSEKQKLFTEVQSFNEEKASKGEFIYENSKRSHSKEYLIIERNTKTEIEQDIPPNDDDQITSLIQREEDEHESENDFSKIYKSPEIAQKTKATTYECTEEVNGRKQDIKTNIIDNDVLVISRQKSMGFILESNIPERKDTCDILSRTKLNEPVPLKKGDKFNEKEEKISNIIDEASRASSCEYRRLENIKEKDITKQDNELEISVDSNLVASFATEKSEQFNINIDEIDKSTEVISSQNTTSIKDDNGEKQKTTLVKISEKDGPKKLAKIEVNSGISEEENFKLTDSGNFMISGQIVSFEENKSNAEKQNIKQGSKNLVTGLKSIDETSSSTILDPSLKFVEDIYPQSFTVEKYVLKEVKQLDSDLVTSLSESKNILTPSQSLSSIKEEVEKAVTMGKIISEEVKEIASDSDSTVDSSCQFFYNPGFEERDEEKRVEVKKIMKKQNISTEPDSFVQEEREVLTINRSEISSIEHLKEPKVTEESPQSSAKQFQPGLISFNGSLGEVSSRNTLPKQNRTEPFDKRAFKFHPSFEFSSSDNTVAPFSIEKVRYQTYEDKDNSKLLQNITLPPLSLEGTSRDYSYGSSIISSPIDEFSESSTSKKTNEKEVSSIKKDYSDAERKKSSKIEIVSSIIRSESNNLSEIVQDETFTGLQSLKKKYDEIQTYSEKPTFQETSLVKSSSSFDDLCNFQEKIDLDILRNNNYYLMKILNLNITDYSSKKSSISESNYGTIFPNDSIFQKELESLYHFILEKEKYMIQSDNIVVDMKESEHLCSKCGVVYKTDEDLNFDREFENFKRNSALNARLQEIFSKSDKDILFCFDDQDKKHVGGVIREMRKLYEYMNVPNYLKNPPVTLPEEESLPYNCCNRCCFCMRPIQLVLKLYINPAFLIICLSRAIHLLTFVGVLTIVVDFSMDRGLKESSGKYAVALMSLGDLIGRLCTGWITDSKIISLEKFMLLAMFFIGIISISFPVLPVNYLLAFFCIYSVLQGSVFIRHPVLVSKYTAVHERTIGMGFMTLFSGLLALVLPYYIGHFRDFIGSYNQVFYINGGLCIAIGFLWIFEPCLKRFEH